MTLSTTNEIAHLRRQLDLTERQTAALRRVVELLGGNMALDLLLTRIIESVMELVSAQCGAIGIGRQESTGPIIEALTSVNFPPRERWINDQPGALALAVLQSRRPIRLDRYADLGQITIPELAEHAILGLPISWGQRLIGVFVLGAAPPHRFSDDDVATAMLFARYAAVAIQQAQLLAAEQRRATRSQTVSHIGRLLSSRLTLDQVLTTAMEDIGQHHPELDIAIMLVEATEPAQLVLRARRGPFYPADRIGQYRQSIGEGIIGSAASERQTLLIQDVTRDPRYLQGTGAAGICAELAIPLLSGNEVLGVFNVESASPLNPDDVEGLTIIAEQLAVAIHNATLYDRTQQVLAETQLLYETSQRMGKAMSVDGVIAAYLEQIAVHDRYVCTVVLFELDAAGRPLEVVIWGRWSTGEGLVRLDQRRPPRPRDPLDPLLDMGQTITISDVQTDPRAPDALRHIQAEVGRPALAMIPLMAQGKRIGQIILSAPRIQHWSETDLRPYQITAAQLATAIDSRRQQQILADQRHHLATLLERRRLARELHDSVTQSLVSINLIAQVLPELWELNQTDARRSLAEMRDQAKGALSEMRALLIELRPDDGETPDLVSALKHQLVTLAGRAGLHLSVTMPPVLMLPPATVHSLARICQEALNNIIRHARARQVSLVVTSDSPLRLIITDDGIGFEPDTIGPGHFGLISMRERAAAIGGRLEIASQPGQGCQLTVTVLDDQHIGHA